MVVILSLAVDHGADHLLCHVDGDLDADGSVWSASSAARLIVIGSPCRWVGEDPPGQVAGL
jgi:hypothetical protein